MKTNVHVSEMEDILYKIGCVLTLGGLWLYRFIFTRIVAKSLGAKENSIYIVLCFLSFGGVWFYRILVSIAIKRAQNLIEQERKEHS